jgi:hypothetical protein
VEQAFALADARRFTRKGTATVAGIRCTVWQVAADAASGTACITADGVPLSASGHDSSGRAGSLEAVRVEYGRQDRALFFPPAGLKRLDLDNLSGLSKGRPAAAPGRQP